MELCCHKCLDVLNAGDSPWCSFERFALGYVGSDYKVSGRLRRLGMGSFSKLGPHLGVLFIRVPGGPPKGP